MTGRSDKLKKLEAELRDLEQWLKLGLVPKKDIAKHETEIQAIRQKIVEEQERLRFIKESGEGEEYITPRKQPTRSQYTEMPSLPDIDITEEAAADRTESSEGDSVFDQSYTEERVEEESYAAEDYTEDEDPFSDKNRWKRGMLHQDEDEW
jgi:hypothetical protein